MPFLVVEVRMRAKEPPFALDRALDRAAGKHASSSGYDLRNRRRDREYPFRRHSLLLAADARIRRLLRGRRARIRVFYDENETGESEVYT